MTTKARVSFSSNMASNDAYALPRVLFTVKAAGRSRFGSTSGASDEATGRASK
jgi:hypothetical protein